MLAGLFLRSGANVGEQLADYTSRVGKTLFGDVDDATTKAASFFKGETVDGIADPEKAVLNQAKSSFEKSGTMYSDEAIAAMKANYSSTGNVFGGLSAATETRSGNLALQSLQEGGIVGLGIGALIGAGGAAVTGGETSEGAMIGAVVGGGIGGVSRALARSASSIEDSMMKRLLGDNYDKLATKEVPGTGGAPAITRELNPDEVRAARLDAVKNMSDDQLNKVSGGRAMQKRLTSNKEDSLLTQSRTLTMAGAFLGGVAFTSKKNDHRRGFNKNRGNRI